MTEADILWTLRTEILRAPVSDLSDRIPLGTITSTSEPPHPLDLMNRGLRLGF